MFVLRGAPAGKRGRMRAPQWDGTALRFSYEGADGRLRTLLADFSLPATVAPRTTEQTVSHFEVALAPQEECSLVTALRVDERGVGDAGAAQRAQAAGSAVSVRFTRTPGGVSAEVAAGGGQIEVVVT